MTAAQTIIEVDFPYDLDQEKIDDLVSRLDLYRPGPGIASLGMVAGTPPTRSVQFVCRGDQLAQTELASLARLIVTDTLEDAGHNPDTLQIRTA